MHSSDSNKQRIKKSIITLIYGFIEAARSGGISELMADSRLVIGSIMLLTCCFDVKKKKYHLMEIIWKLPFYFCLVVTR